MSDPRDKGNWAEAVEALRVGDLPPGAESLNVEGRRVTGPLQGFGRLWQRTYRIALDGAVDPTEVIRTWKQRYGDFWPTRSHFYPPLAGIAPGEIGLITDETLPVRLTTGVLVLYSDDTSFTYVTPEGHPFAGWVTFSAFRDDDAATIAQVQVLMRPSDPLFDVGFALMGGKLEDETWRSTLRALARHFGATTEPTTEIVCVDRRRQWRHVGNIRWNIALRGIAHGVGSMMRRRHPTGA